jgi:beta-glucanase (GH16 family)
MNFSRPKSTVLASSAMVLLISPLAGGQTQTPGWTLVWNDEFDGTALDLDKWTPESTTNPANNERQAYLPQQVTVSGGNMVITSENVPFANKQYQSGRVHSNYVQRHGRWEVRADLPTSRGMWPAIWLLPNASQYRWPSQGEIDIMENRGHQPTLTSSAYHFGTNPPFFHSYRTAEQTTARFGEPEDYHAGLHTYAVEWDSSKVRFFVDDVHHWTVYDADTNGYLGNQTAPMQTMLNTAVGGDFLGGQQPDATTVWPQQFLIDYVRIYEKNDDPITFRNGGFESSDGSLAGWSVFGNRANTNNVSVHEQAVADGAASLKLFGQSTGDANFAGVSQGITVAAGDEVFASAESFIRSQDSIAATANTVVMKIEFYRDFGGRHGTAALLQEVVETIADATSPNDEWRFHELSAVAPEGALEARLAFVFTQAGTAGGAVHLDKAQFVNPRLSLDADADGDGDVDGDDLELWRQQHGLEGDLPADANGDGAVDGADFLQWQRELGAGASLPAAGASGRPVPETCSSAMALAALVGLMLRS